MYVSPWMNRFRNRLSRQRMRRLSRSRQATERLEDRTLLTVVGTVTGSGAALDPVTLTIFEDGGEDLIVQRDATTGNVQVLADGSVVTSIPPVATTDVEVLEIFGSDTDTSIDLSALTTGFFTSLTEITVNAGDGDDTLTGSDQFGETLIGSDGNDVINGGGSNDSLDGGNGNDTLDGGDGDDVIEGDDGDDSITGGTGNDTIDSEDGQDTVDGGDGNDTIDAGEGDDSVDGGAGLDSIQGGSGNDTINGGDDNDSIRGGGDNDSITGGNGNDSLFGQGGQDTILGEIGNDSIEGGSSSDSLEGGIGDDTIDGGTEADLIDGGGGDDLLIGSHGNDTVTGNLDNDTLFGGAGRDSLDGGRGEDFVFGQGSNDTLSGGTDGDVVQGGAGNDIIFADGEADAIVPTLSVSDVSITEGDGFLLAGNFVTSADVTRAVSASGDFDGDGSRDLAVPLDDGTLEIFLNDGTGNLVSTSVIPFGSPNPPNASIAVTADLNGDGLDDVAVTHRQDSTVTVSLSVGGGLFGPANTIDVTGNNNAQFPLGIRAADMDGDGDIDLVPTSELGETGGLFFPRLRGTIILLRNNGNGTFQAPVFTELGPNFTVTASRYLDLGDVDGNGTVDAVIPLQSVGIVSIVDNNGTGGFINEQQVPLGGGTSPNIVELADIDGDGDLDAVVGDDNLNQFYLLSNDGSGVFSLSQTVSVTGSGGPVAIPRVLDADGDGDTDVIVAAGNTQALFLNDGSGTLTQAANYAVAGFGVVDDISGDGRPDIAISESPSSIQVLQNNFIGPVTATVTVTLSQVATEDVTVDYSTADGLALQNVDYTPQSGTLTFPAGSTSQQFSIEILRELLAEPDENFFVELSNASGANIADAQGQVLINDDDGGSPQAAITVSDLSINPEGSSTSIVTVTVMLTQTSASNVTVEYATTDGTALAGSDYVATNGTLTIAAGSTSATFTVTHAGDMRPELDETFFVDLSNPVGATMIQSRATITIVNDDGTPPTPRTGDVLFGDDGNDELIGGNGDDLLKGGNGDDSLSGEDGNDTLAGDAGNDTLGAGTGNDTYVWTGQADGTDILSDATGFQTLLVNGDDTANSFTIDQNLTQLRVSEGTGSITINSTVTNVVVNGGDGDDVITLSGLDSRRALLLTVNGDAGNDTIDGSSTLLGSIVAFLNGGDGNDSISGSRSAEMIDGGADDDSIFGNQGDDTIFGRGGNDTISGDAGNDRVEAGIGNDSVLGGDGEDTLLGEAGDDFVNGDADNDVVEGGSGNDTAVGSFGDDIIRGGTGDDFVFAGSGDDSISGGTGNDYIRGHSGNDQIKGGDGDDTIRGDQGDDVVNAGDGNDFIETGDGFNIVNADDGNDTVVGGRQADTIIGGDGHDLLIGGGGRDFLYGGDGNDTLLGNGSGDFFNSGEGDSDSLGDLMAGEFDNLDLTISSSVQKALAALNGF